MNKNKSLYEAPHTDVLVVRFEGALLQASITSFSSQGTETLGYDTDEDL